MKPRKRIIVLGLVLAIIGATINPLQVEASTLSNQKDASGVYRVAEGVEVIGKDTFKNNTKITEVILPSTIKIIEDYAFYGATNLKKINFPRGLQSIGLGAFEKSGLTGSITIPGTVQTIENLAFAGTVNLTKVVIEEGVRKLGVYPFAPELKELHLPSTITSADTLYNSMYGGTPREAGGFTIYVPRDSSAHKLVNGYTNVIATDVTSPVVQDNMLALKKEEVLKAPYEVKAVPTNQRITVDGKVTNFRAYNINGNNYFMLRDIAHIFNGSKAQFEVGWDGNKNAISLTTGTRYTGKGEGFALTSAHVEERGTRSKASIYKNGKEIVLLGYTIQGYTYFKLRDLGGEVGIGVAWDAMIQTVVMKSDPTAEIVAEEKPKEDLTPKVGEARYVNGYRVYDPWEVVDTSHIKPWDEKEEAKAREDMLALINKERAAIGVHPLVLDATLIKAAEYKAVDLKKVGRKEGLLHSGTYGEYIDLLKMFNLEDKYGAENLTSAGVIPETMHRSWMNSGGHRENLLNPKYNKLGVGFEYMEMHSNIYDKEVKGYKGEVRYSESDNKYYYIGPRYWAVTNFSE